MRKITLVAIAAALTATGFAVWAAAPTKPALPPRARGLKLSNS